VIEHHRRPKDLPKLLRYFELGKYLTLKPLQFNSEASVHYFGWSHNKEVSMSENLYPQATRALAQKRGELAPAIEAAFRQFSQAVFRDGALPGKTKQADRRRGRARHAVPLLHRWTYQGCASPRATPEELMEAIWVAAEMRAGGAYAHSALALETMDEAGGR
jgi:alkylhydroperoxidase/carboxymuconolactone decarboxylase family protein YurZ